MHACDCIDTIKLSYGINSLRLLTNMVVIEWYLNQCLVTFSYIGRNFVAYLHLWVLTILRLTLLSTVESTYWENAPVKSIGNGLPCMHSQLNFIAVLQHIQRNKCACVRKCDANEWPIKIEKWFGNQMTVSWNKIEKFWN